MTDAPISPGLCSSCLHVRVIRSDRGSAFYQCRLSVIDPNFPKYPRLPVLSCAGYRVSATVKVAPDKTMPP